MNLLIIFHSARGVCGSESAAIFVEVNCFEFEIHVVTQISLKFEANIQYHEESFATSLLYTNNVVVNTGFSHYMSIFLC